MSDSKITLPPWSFDLSAVIIGAREKFGGYETHVGYCAPLSERICVPLGAGFGMRAGAAPKGDQAWRQGNIVGTFEIEQNLRLDAGLQFLLAVSDRSRNRSWPSLSLGLQAIGGGEWISGHYARLDASGSAKQEGYEELGFSYGGRIYSLARGSEAVGIIGGLSFLSLPGAGLEPDRSFGIESEIGLRILLR